MTRIFLVCALLLLGGCTFTYIPPLREARAPEPRLSILDQSALKQSETSLELNLRLATVPEADWLTVQWFDPANDEVAAESVWIGPAPKPQAVAVSLPARTALKDGLWRAVVSYQGELARQFSVTVRVPRN